MLALVVGLVAGCASPGGHRTLGASPSGPDDVAAEARCRFVFARLDEAAQAARATDAMTTRVPGFPYLRVDRLLASFRNEALDDAARAQWIALMADADRDARRHEIANLPGPERSALARDLGAAGIDLERIDTTLEACATRLTRRDLMDPRDRAALAMAARVPDDYVDHHRVLGAYPLAAALARIGIEAYAARVQARFSTPEAALPVRGALRQYLPPATARPEPATVAALLARARDNPLRIPRPDAASLATLARAFAPALVVDEVDGADRTGRLQATGRGAFTVDATEPVAYVRAAQTRWNDEVLLQLVYTFWFPARRPAGHFDLLAGRLDGLVWRVTLTAAGTPLLYDSIHPCGCYHLFLPTARLAARPPAPGLDEGALIAGPAPTPAAGERTTLRVESGTHYLQRATAAAPAPIPARTYALLPDDELRSLPLAAGERTSLYDGFGLVPGTERPERLFLWPLGVPSAGAMRQWGRHATAFVGRRHFDEPFLIARYFAPAAAGD